MYLCFTNTYYIGIQICFKFSTCTYYLLYSTELCSMKGENWKKIENNEYKFHT